MAEGVCCIGTADLQLWYTTIASTSAADDITHLNVFHSVNIGLFGVGEVVKVDDTGVFDR